VYNSMPMDAKLILLAALVVLTIGYIAVWFVEARRRRAAGSHGAHEAVAPTGKHLGIGFVTNFFDTLGIGSFATTTASYKFWRLIPDQQIPGTLNVGHTINATIQALVFIVAVAVEFQTLVLMIAASCAGAWLGAGIVAGFSRRKVQLGMGTALLFAAAIVLAQIFNLAPGGEALALNGTSLGIGLAGNFMLGALMTLGVGLYAPCMVLVSILGMNPAAAFPIMMGSCAFLMPVASIQFIRRDAYNLRAALGLALGGPLAVLLAIWLVTSLPTPMVRVLVFVVIVYTSLTMLRSAAVERRTRAQVAQPA
jgi:uncharacterized membrane protein YfcA